MDKDDELSQLDGCDISIISRGNDSENKNFSKIFLLFLKNENGCLNHQRSKEK